MCGFAGILDRHQRPEVAREQLRRMGQVLSHRGPDAEGIGVYPEIGLAWVHRRLAIQDLSEMGTQPMTSDSGRYALVFNGEIYNFRVLRQTLEGRGHRFNGHSDTEVLLAAIEEWGVETAITRAQGMFAIAVLDREEHFLYLIRDRLGEKPLYYALNEAALWFGSELKALCEYPAFDRKINRDALPLLLRHNFIPGPHTIYENVFKLAPATIARFNLSDPGPQPQFMQYWQADEHWRSAPQATSPLQAVDQLDGLLQSVIDDQCIADVPLGAFLSGGVDSSVVAAIMKSRGGTVHTYSIGFRESGFDESVYAREVAGHLQTDHTELVVSAEDALSVIPRLPLIYDEPFADSSQIPTVLLCELTRQHVTVALSGDGGDELFCGYTRYAEQVAAWRKRRGLRGWLLSRAHHLPPEWVRHMVGLMRPAYKHLKAQDVAEKLERISRINSATTLTEAYREAVSYWSRTEQLVSSGRCPDYALTRQPLAGLDDYRQLMRADLSWYLPDDILVKVDRAAMAASLETRVPLLDPRIVEFALSLPAHWNRQDGLGKYILRQVLYRYVPREMVDRPKQGFAIPKAEWLRGPLKSWADELLNTDRLIAEGYWNAKQIAHCWAVHKAGHYDYAFQLWGVLMFQAWLDHYD